MNYTEFLNRKTHLSGDYGFDPLWLPDCMFDFQKSLVEWATKKGRAALFADCGLGKTLMQLVWAENVCRKSDGKVLILTPLAVSAQTVKEAEKFGIEAEQSRDGKHTKKIVVTNYEKLHLFNSTDFVGCVCDESSILKNFNGATKQSITEFMLKLPYRLLCTATAAPNDFMELGTSAEALGMMKYKEMLSMFFIHDGGDTAKWRLKKHAESSVFWRWMAQWARACRKPSDIGFNNDGFDLPILKNRMHIIESNYKDTGYLFNMPAIGLDEQRAERKSTMKERCEMAAQLANQNESSILWCHLNSEGDLLEKITDDCVQVSGSDSDEKKEEYFNAFESGEVKRMITKPSIAGFGLNWQHCSHQTFFPSHSFEQYYQSVRRSWRFGQKNPVTVDIVTSEGEQNVMANMERKIKQAEELFMNLVSHMSEFYETKKTTHTTSKMRTPKWI